MGAPRELLNGVIRFVSQSNLVRSPKYKLGRFQGPKHFLGKVLRLKQWCHKAPKHPHTFLACSRDAHMLL